MIVAAQVRVLAIGVAFALGVGGGAQARSHGGHEGHQASHGSAVHGMAHGRGTPIAYSTGRHGSFQRYAQQDIGHFGSRRGHANGRSEGRSYYAASGGGIQCVTFARADSGIELSGNASAWWDNAAGVYARGNRPEAGSVLNFRANGAMRMGHVAVVNQVVDSRTIDIDHANWGGPGAVRGGISRDISVVDVSPANDWSAVRVALGHSGEYGSIYPTYGFIYNRPDRGMMVAANDHSAAIPALNPAPRDLRGRAVDTAYDEVAEAPDSAMPSFAHHPASHRHHAMALPHHHLHHGRV